MLSRLYFQTMSPNVSIVAGCARVGLLAGPWIGLPLIGTWLAGRPLAPYLVWPPAAEPRTAAPFNGWIFGLVAVLILLALAPVGYRLLTSRMPSAPQSGGHWPVWGWAGLMLLLAGWGLAWTRFDALESVQRYAHTPLWLGYILVINALALRRRGHCPLLDRPRRFAVLFPLSAGFWWLFEYLDLYTGNWYYLNTAAPESAAYQLSSTLAFATVLPAVLSTQAWLAGFPRLSAGLDRFRRPSPALADRFPRFALVAAVLGLIALGGWPHTLFPLLWLAPLALVIGLQGLLGQPGTLATVAVGDWRPVWLVALAALVCGLFWEFWNYGSLAQWRYALPYVDRFRLFEMPLLGYAGYLPFGPLCLAVTEYLLGLSPLTNPLQITDRTDQAGPDASLHGR